MTAITQRIPDFFGGINEAPDLYKGQGQVSEAENCIPDLTRGLYKRPGAQRVGSPKVYDENNVLQSGTDYEPLAGVDTSSNHWFHYYRDEDEGSYIGQVKTDGSVAVWSCKTGEAVNVTYESGQQNDLQTYMSYDSPASGDLQFTTINDTTFVCNRNQPVLMKDASVNSTPTNPHTYVAFVELKQVVNGRQYSLNIHDPSSSATTSISSATRLSVTPDNSEGFTSFSGGEGHCPRIGTKIFKEGGSNGRDNLIFRLTVTGQQGPVPDSTDPPDITKNTHYTCSYRAEIDLLHGGEGWAANDTVTVTLEGFDYTITVENVETATFNASLKAVRPEPTPFDQQTSVSTDTILGSLKEEIDSINGGGVLQSKIIGNGLYIRSNSQNFTVTTPNTDLLTVITDSTNDITNLPTQAKDGYIVKVANTAAQEDDYYLKFEGDSGSDGPGSWSECAKPGIERRLDSSTLPCVIERLQDTNNNTIYFNVKKFVYADREVGDRVTNPKPSFVTLSTVHGDDRNENRTINKVLFFRNRLCFLSGDNVVLSRPGDLGNFFVKTALTVAADDPIDISCSSTYPSELFDGIEQNTGLLVFGKNQQFLLATDSDILQPESAKLSSIATYNYNADLSPISMGTIAGFVDNAGAFSRFFVMANVAREGEPQVVELSKVVSRQLDNDLNLIANSRENQFVFLGKRGSKDVFGYRYFGTIERQLQSAWFKWKHSKAIKYHFVTDDTYFFVDSQYFLQKIDLIRDAALTVREDGTDYLVHLDNYAPATGGSYDAATNKTTFTLSWLADISNPKNDLTAVKGGTDGTIITGIDVPNTTTDVKVPGDWSGQELTFGYDYTMKVVLPQFFVQTKTGNVTVNESRGSLVVHRVNLEFSRVGSYETVLTRVGKPEYTQQFSSTELDDYLVGDVRVNDTYSAYVPVYEKNDNFTLSIKSTSPLPATLTSLTWEGDYNPGYYKRV